MEALTLYSFAICPFVQRAVIALRERGETFETVYLDPDARADWFADLSPLGKVPVLKVQREGEPPAVLFESAVILEYIEDTRSPRMHPEDALERARHRAWIEYGSQVLADFNGLVTAQQDEPFAEARQRLRSKFERLEPIVQSPFFAGDRFSNVDAVFAPVFRQLDALESVAPLQMTEGLMAVTTWRSNLRARPSVMNAVPDDYRKLYLDRIDRFGGVWRRAPAG